jgi:carboxymethylenebutenolidase
MCLTRNRPGGASGPAHHRPLRRVHLHYAGLDERINAGIAAFTVALQRHGKSFEVHMYDGANHAFANDTNSARYDEAAAKLAWGRTVEFLRKRLGG